MRLAINNYNNQIEIGDIVLDSKGELHLVSNSGDSHYPITFVNLQTGRRGNSWTDLESINKQRIVTSSNSIVQVIKNKDVVISEERPS